MTDEILFARENHIGLITLNRVHALNALTLPMILAMQAQLIAWKKDDNIKAVIIKAAPGKAFCAGGDIRKLYETAREKNLPRHEFFWHEYRLNHFIHHFGKPYIALMDGITMGGGVGISLHGSHPVAFDHFNFAMPETSIGFFPDIGASHLLSRCPGAYGIYLGLTGKRLDASSAKALGLVRFIIESSQLDALVSDLCSSDLSINPHKAVDDCLKSYQGQINIEPEIGAYEGYIQDSFGCDSVENIISALQQGASEWHQETLKGLQSKSPLSLKITFTQLRKASSLNLAQCLEMDYNLVNHFLNGNDFYEGVRALIIDKDKQPIWQPQTLAHATDALVADYFKPVKEPLQFISES